MTLELVKCEGVHQRAWTGACKFGHLIEWPEGKPYHGCPYCLQERRDDPERFMKEAGVPPRYRPCTHVNFIRESEKASQKAQLVRTAGDKSVYLYGPCGAGKTHLAVALLRERMLALRDVRMETAARIMLRIRATWHREAAETEAQVLRHFRSFDTLLIDDFGAQDASDKSRSSLLQIIDERYTDERQTIITSNFTPERVEEEIDERISSRFSHGLMVQMDLPDWRRRR